VWGASGRPDSPRQQEPVWASPGSVRQLCHCAVLLLSLVVFVAALVWCATRPVPEIRQDPNAKALRDMGAVLPE